MTEDTQPANEFTQPEAPIINAADLPDTLTAADAFRPSEPAVLPELTNTPDPMPVPTEPAESLKVAEWPTLTPQRIEECKVLNPGRQIYRYDSMGVVIVYKGLSGSEYKALTERFRAEGELSTSERQDEQTAAMAVVWPRLPENWFQSALAGHAQTLALLVRQQSGFSLTTLDGRILGKQLTTEEIDPQEQPVPEEPTEEEIQSIRAQAPGQQIFLATFPDGTQNLFTPLPRVEWTSVSKRLEKDDKLDPALEVTRYCVKWPKNHDWDKDLAGKLNMLYDAIMKRSGFDVEPVVVEL